MSDQASTERVDSGASATLDGDEFLGGLPALLAAARSAGGQREELLRASVLVAERARAAAIQARARLHDAERTAAELAALSAEARQVVAACVAQFRQAPIRDGIKPTRR